MASVLAVLMVWAVSAYTNNGSASQELLEMNGLIKKSLFGGQTPQVSSLSQYVWGGCDEDCPSGTTHATNRKGKSASNVAIYSGCFNGQKRNYCCPTDDVPTCQWVRYFHPSSPRYICQSFEQLHVLTIQFSKARLSYAVAIPAQREKFKSQPINLPRAIAVGSTISPCAVLRPHPMQQLDSTVSYKSSLSPQDEGVMRHCIPITH